MRSIVIIGLPGCGKTVFVTSFAKYVASAENTTGITLDPVKVATQRFVEDIWETLQSQRWPESTKPGTLANLQWRLAAPGVPESELRIVDVAGQDWKRLFGQEDVDRLQELPEQLRHAVEYFQQADIALLLVNLQDFIGESDPQIRLTNQWTTKYALDRLIRGRQAPRITLVFTQIDQFQDELQLHGNDWREVARKHLPIVYDDYVRNQTAAINVLGIASVSDTVPELGENGSRRVPAPDFQSVGFPELTAWVGKQLQGLAAQAAARDLQKFRKDRWERLKKSLLLAVLFGVLAQLITLPILRRMCRDEIHDQIPIVTSSPRIIYHPGSWYKFWKNAWNETIPDTTTTYVPTVAYVVKTHAVVLWDTLLSAVIVLVVCGVSYKFKIYIWQSATE